MTKITKGRLTGDIKNTIRWAVGQELKKLFTPINEREHVLALEILKDEAGEYWDQLNALPQGFINRTCSLYLSLTNDERQEIIEVNGLSHLAYTQTLDLDEYYPGNGHANRSLSLLTKKQKATFKQIIGDRALVMQKIDSGMKELEKVLASVTSVQKLIEIWPDVMDYMPEEPEKVDDLPAVQTTTLDSLLPVEKKAA